MTLATGAAPGKVILFGEHAVVYGRPAVAASLGCGLGATAESGTGGPLIEVPGWGREGLIIRPDTRDFDALSRAFATALDAAGLGRPDVKITLDGALPLGVGLGSSAALAVVLLRVLGQWRGEPFTKDALLDAAARIESVFHGNPSGLDHTVIARGGCLRYARDAQPKFIPICVARPIPVVIAWSPRQGDTRQIVEALGARHAAQPHPYEQLFDAMGQLADAGIAALEAGDLALLGTLFNINHGYLNACGVSNLANEQMVRIARENGALGAKLTGAGVGGAVIALIQEGDSRVLSAFNAAGFEGFSTVIEATP